MRWGRAVLGAVMVAIGGVWFLQGIRILPGSFMTGSGFWAVAGAVVGLAGLSVLASLRRARGRRA
jgi:hypothetical protein